MAEKETMQKLRTIRVKTISSNHVFDVYYYWNATLERSIVVKFKKSAGIPKNHVVGEHNYKMINILSGNITKEPDPDKKDGVKYTLWVHNFEEAPKSFVASETARILKLAEQYETEKEQLDELM